MRSRSWSEKRPRGRAGAASSLMAGALGAGLMYFLDPRAGRTRRNAVRHRIERAARLGREALALAGRGVGNRVRGWGRNAAGLLDDGSVPDEVLVEWVRAELGHLSSHPGPIDVWCEEGVVTLTGPILADERANIVRRVRRVRGVQRLEDRLQALGAPGAAPRRHGWRSHRCGRGERAALEIDRTLHVAAQRHHVFAFWHAMEQFPRFMTHVQEVKRLSDRRYLWTVEGPGTLPITWEAEVTGLVPGELIAWRTVEGALVQSSAVVQLHPEPDGTRVRVRMKYAPAAGAADHLLASLFGADPRRRMNDDLRRFKSLVEEDKAPGAEVRATWDEILPGPFA
jgi:uncharacterized membrane protein